jgi:hypothetical protein
MEFTLTMCVDNAAFVDDLNGEIARILRETARKVGDDGRDGGTLVDVNGNNVGSFDIVEDANDETR